MEKREGSSELFQCRMVVGRGGVPITGIVGRLLLNLPRLRGAKGRTKKKTERRKKETNRFLLLRRGGGEKERALVLLPISRELKDYL